MKYLTSLLSVVLALAPTLAAPLVLAPSMTGCICTSPVAFPSLEVSVTDATTGATINGVTLTATRNDGTSTPVTIDGASSGSGRYTAWIARGQYTLHAEASGYQAVDRSIEVTSGGGCDANPTRVAVAMTRR
jgi:hypothetical protein